MTCITCTEALPDGSRFCSACGTGAGVAVAFGRRRLGAVAHRIRHLDRAAVVAVAVAVVMLTGIGAGVVREQSRSHQLSSAQTSLRDTRTDLTKARAEGALLTTQLATSTDKVASLGTQIAGVRGTLKASQTERNTLRTCFSGFLDSLDAAYRGDQAGYDAIWKRIKADCDKSDAILGRP